MTVLRLPSIHVRVLKLRAAPADIKETSSIATCVESSDCHYEASLTDLKDHPASALRFEVAEDSPRSLGKVRWVNQINATALCPLSGLDVVTG